MQTAARFDLDADGEPGPDQMTGQQVEREVVCPA